MSQRNRTVVAVILFAVLLLLSFFKDVCTPDYYNTASAAFLADHPSRFPTLISHTSFWLFAFLYSIVFVLFPPLIVQVYFGNRQQAFFVLVCTAGICAVLYALVFAGSGQLDRSVIPKVNRYFHSPIVTLFFIATFKLTQPRDQPH